MMFFETGKKETNLIFLQVIGEVGDHDLGLGGDTVLRGTALLALAGFARLTGSLLLLGTLFNCERFVRSFCQRNNLAGYICRSAVSRSRIGELDLFYAFGAVGVLEIC
jgi:hypothetical protein